MIHLPCSVATLLLHLRILSFRLRNCLFRPFPFILFNNPFSQISINTYFRLHYKTHLKNDPSSLFCSHFTEPSQNSFVLTWKLPPLTLALILFNNPSSQISINTYFRLYYKTHLKNDPSSLFCSHFTAPPQNSFVQT